MSTTAPRRTRSIPDPGLTLRARQLAAALNISDRTAAKLLAGGRVLPAIRQAAEAVAPSLGIALS